MLSVGIVFFSGQNKLNIYLIYNQNGRLCITRSGDKISAKVIITDSHKFSEIPTKYERK